jgi:hypothetical protein
LSPIRISIWPGWRSQRATSCRQTSRSSIFGVQPEAPKEPAVAGAVAVIGGVGELAAARCFDAARAFHRRGVDQQHVIEEAGAVPGELGNQRLEHARQPQPALVVRAALGQHGEQMSQAGARDREEALVGRDAKHRLGDAERDDLRIGDPSARVPRPLGQEIVGGAEHRNQQQIEVGEHRGPSRSSVRESTADFDLPAYEPFSTATTPTRAVAQLI